MSTKPSASKPADAPAATTSSQVEVAVAIAPAKQQSEAPLESVQLNEARPAATAQSPPEAASYCAPISAQVTGEPTAAASSAVAGPPASRQA